MIKIILIIMTVFILYCMIETARELRDFRLTKYRICSPKLNGIRGTKKIIFLSDLHNRMYGKENERLLKSIKNQHPDLILIGGDMLAIPMTGRYAFWKNFRQSARSTVRMVIMNRS